MFRAIALIGGWGERVRATTPPEPGNRFIGFVRSYNIYIYIYIIIYIVLLLFLQPHHATTSATISKTLPLIAPNLLSAQ